MLAPRNVANCYVVLFKRGGRSIDAARASTNQYAYVHVGVSPYCCIRAYVSRDTLPACWLTYERNRQAASVVGCWGTREVPNLAAPAVSAPGANQIPTGSQYFSGKTLFDWHRSASWRATRPAIITWPVNTRASRPTALLPSGPRCS